MSNDRKICALFTFPGNQGGSQSEEWLDFPATKESLRQLLGRIGGDKISGCTMSPMFWENETASQLGRLASLLVDEISVNELNYLSEELSAFDEDMFAKFEAIVESGKYTDKSGVGVGEIADYINIVQNLNNFTFFPNFDEQRYGEHLLSGRDNFASRVISILQRLGSKDGDYLASCVEALRECADEVEFGRSMALNNNGDFLDSGYLIDNESFEAVYYGPMDIPVEHIIWEPRDSFIKAVDVQLSMLLLEMHALGGNYTQDAANNFQTLLNNTDLIITESRDQLAVMSAAEVFIKDSPYNIDFLKEHEPNVRAFFATVKEIDTDKYWGNIHEIDVKAMKSDVARLNYASTYIDVEFKDGTNCLYTIAEWNAKPISDREQAAGMIPRYNPDDEQKATEFICALREIGEKNGQKVIPEDFLANINAPFMARVQNQQPGMLRIAREAARAMLARDDAEIFRLMPVGAVKLSPLDVVKSKGLWYPEHREFAIKIGGMSGLMKWAKRTADDISRQSVLDERNKSRSAER